MTRRSSLTVALMVTLAAGHSGIRAQKAPSAAASSAPTPEPEVSDSAPRTILVDAIVTDRQGRPIVNLKPADFVVSDDGVAQKIDSAELKSRATVSASAPPAPALAVGDDNDVDEAERAAREPGTRVIAIYLDEFHVSAGESTERVRNAVTSFLIEQVRPTDLLVVIKPLDHLTNIRFTRDRGAARDAIENFSGRKDDYTPKTPFEEQYMGRSPAAVRAARAQIVMSGLRALVTRMGELDTGLAGIVLVTEGFSSDLPRSRERRLPDLQGLARAAGRYRVLLYTFDPAMPGAAASSEPASGDDNGVPAIMALQTLARQTGGDVVIAGQDLASALRSVSRDLDAYYVLKYTSTSPSDGRFHKVEVTSTRRDAIVRVRAGYWAPLPSELRTARSNTVPITPMRAVRRSPLIQSWTGLMIDSEGRRHVIFTWSPVVGTARPAKPVGRADIVTLKVTTLGGTVLFEGDVAPAERSISGQRNDSATFLATPGRLQFDYTVAQADGTKLDVGSQDFDVPEIRPGLPVILQPQLFRAASAREFREISTDAAAAPLPGREFRRTDRVLLRVPAYDPSGSQLEVSATLINRVGAVLLELTPMPNEGKVTVSQFDLPLARFAPGEYSIEVAARSTSGLARELIRLRITG